MPPSETAPQEDVAADSRVVYAICSGIRRDAGGAGGIEGFITIRNTKEDAESVAEALNNALEGLFFLRSLASFGFPNAMGDGEALLKAAEDDEYIAQWEQMKAQGRMQTYTVIDLAITDPSDIQKYDEEMAKLKK